MLVRAIANVDYDGKTYSVGDKFECLDEHAKVLTYVNKVVAAEYDEQQPRKGRYGRRDMRVVE